MNSHASNETGFISDCSCFSCRVGKSEWERRRVAAIKAGEPFTTTGHRTAERLRQFEDAGFTMKAVGRVIGMDGRELRRILDDPSVTILRRTEKRVLTIRPSAIRPGRVPARGSVRRVRDLSLRGFRLVRIALASGLSENTVRNLALAKNDVISHDTADRISAAYEYLARKPYPTDPKSLSWARKAEMRGWWPLAKYDDPDDPALKLKEAR